MTTPPGEGEPPRDPYGPPADQPGWQGPQAPQGYPAYQAPYGPYAPDHPRAITALVLGILGIVFCQVAAPFALVIGRRTVDEIDASGGRVGGRGSAQAGYVLGIVGTVLLGLGVLWVVVLVGVAFLGLLGLHATPR